MMRQRHYIKNVLIWYNLQNKRNLQTLMQPNTQLVTDNNLPEDECVFMSKILYMNMVGSLWYIVNCTQLDIVFITSQLAKHLKSPSMLHYNALVYYMQYLKGTKDKWLLFGCRNHDNITGYTDTDRMM